MRQRLLLLAFGLFVLVLQAGQLQAQPMGAVPLFTYSGDVLPSQDGWSILSQKHNASEVNKYGSYEPIAMHAENGVLHITDDYTYDGSAIWYSRQWEVNPGLLNVAEFDIKGASCGGSGPSPGYLCIYFGTSDGYHNMVYTVHPDRIESAYMDYGQYGPNTIAETYFFDTTQMFNTYTAVIVDGRALLYINDVLVLDQLAGHGIYDVKGVEFGAGSSTAFGDAFFNEIRAYRIPSSKVPEPGMLLLLGSGLLGLIAGGHMFKRHDG